ncbi:MAG: DUF3540 domain-containing protein, partial [Desulfovibrio sp.]|nr:DUF3540 domain-containing protein [Desulfovibrio sp.]
MGSALPLPLNDNEIVSGTVRTADADGLLVTVGPLGLVRARRAAGCLLAPEAGDGVLLALLGSGEAWVLTVLAKKTELGSLALPAHTLLRAESLDMTTTRGSWRGESLSLEGGS